jgi:hypothetical protein
MLNRYNIYGILVNKKKYDNRIQCFKDNFLLNIICYIFVWQRGVLTVEGLDVLSYRTKNYTRIEILITQTTWYFNQNMKKRQQFIYHLTQYHSS